MDEYIQMVRLKTAVLLVVPFAWKPWWDRHHQIRQMVVRFRVNLGIAFQLQDDLLDALETQKPLEKSRRRYY